MTAGVCMSRFCLFVLGNGRRAYLERTIASWEENLVEKPDYQIIFDDSGDSNYRQWLQDKYGDRFDIVYFDAHPVGQTKAVQSIFDYIRDLDVEYVLELEEDWLLFRELSLQPIFDVLKNYPDVVQMRIPRTIWYADYHRFDLDAGSLLLDYINNKNAEYEFMGKWFNIRSDAYFFSHNPNVFRKDLINKSYNESGDHEHSFGINLMNENPKATFGYWSSNPYDGYVTHIGIKDNNLLNSLGKHERLTY